jgi:hypothetical protein
MFLQSWTQTLLGCVGDGHSIYVSCRQSCNIYYVRNLCLGGSVMRGPNQKPFNGEIDYDYTIWLDSDISFHYLQIKKLLSYGLDIISGLYLMDDSQSFATVRTWDKSYFKKHGTFQFLTPADIKGITTLIEVDYTGFGLIIIKKGVFESLDYPWFRPLWEEIGPARDFSMEDVGFCRMAQRRGYRVMIDPTVIVGHQKMRLLHPEFQSFKLANENVETPRMICGLFSVNNSEVVPETVIF